MKLTVETSYLNANPLQNPSTLRQAAPKPIIIIA